MTHYEPLNEQTLDRLAATLADIEESEELRRQKREADDDYEPPAAGTIDSHLYLVNLHAYAGQFLGPLLHEVREGRKLPA